MTQIDIAALAAQAAEQDDFTKEQKGGFEREVPTEGPCFVRLREYIELGDQKPPQWKVEAYGKSKAKPQAMWVFEVVAAVRTNDEGERYNAARRKITPEGGDEFEVAETVTIRTDISKNGKSAHFKLFSKLNGAYGGKYVHPAQLLECDGWIARIVHRFGKDDTNDDGTPKAGAKPTGIQLKTRGDGSWTFAAPYREDAETGERTKLKVPELLGGTASRKIFLWDQPNQACWDSLFIEGERDEKDASGKETGKKVSKNWIQETILKAVNFKGSALDTMLSGAGGLEAAADAEVSGTVDDDPLADLD